MNSTVKTVVFWLVIVLAGVLLWQVVKGANSGAKERDINYSEFVSQVDQDNVSEVTVVGNDVHGKFKNDKSSFHVVVPPNYPTCTSRMTRPRRQHHRERRQRRQLHLAHQPVALRVCSARSGSS